jgi:dihydrofolate synthase/folylpolyglutamate synthase
LLLGVLADKDYKGLTAILDEAADEYICISPDSPRALPAKALADWLNRYNKPVACCDSIRDGVSLALDRSDADSVVCAVGSLYSVGEIRACFERY